MKNRLEIAKEFLRDDGVIFVQCDDNEQAYLKVLMDEIFGRENFVANFIWQKKSSGGQHANFVLDFHEYILCYAKHISSLNAFKMPRTEKQIESFKFEDEFVTTRGKYLTSPLKSHLEYRQTLIYDIECPDKSVLNMQWICAKDTFEKLKSESRILFKQNKNGEWSIYKKQYLNDNDGLVKPPSMLLDCGNSAQATREIKALFGDEKAKIFSTPKPEALLKRIIEISTQENDLVMDFFAGSGTTLAVAMKMKRRFIGIEQMDYVKSITKERLKKVVEGEQGGISKAVGWNPLSPSLAEGDKGGGLLPQSKYETSEKGADSTLPLALSAREGELPKNEFIYCELIPLNAVFKEQIQASNDESELERIYKDLQEKAFVDYRVDIKEMLKDKDFEALNLDEKKRILLSVLDSNMDYVPLSEIEDSEYGISSELVELNKAFFKGGEDE